MNQDYYYYLRNNTIPEYNKPYTQLYITGNSETLDIIGTCISTKQNFHQTHSVQNNSKKQIVDELGK